uniref:hypothetical protein n=1 Tax=Ningiella ruwaisensis TaxID=2364274 RepID=UPI0010A0815F|nr:hypothetical protein [Ningiella ruwaisensis]
MKHFILLVALAIGFSFPSNAQKKVHILNTPAGERTSFSRVFTDDEGKVYLSWVAQNPEKTLSTLYFAQLDEDGSTWQGAISVVSGSNWFNNWADFPSVIKNKNLVTAHFLQKSGPGSYDYDVKLTFSSDNGLTWLTPFTAHNDGVTAEHGFVSMIPLDNGNTLVSWLDGRNTKASSGTDSHKDTDGHNNNHDNGHGHAGAMTLRAGEFTFAGAAVNRWQLDDRVCECCQTSTALTAKGPAVVYRNRSTHEVRDIFITRSIDDVWTDPVPVHTDGWEIAGCPVNGPVIQAKNNNVAFAWFTGKDQIHQVKLATSDESGFPDIAVVDNSVFVTWTNSEQC